MKRKRSNPECINEPRRLAALASPLRMELIGALRTHGPASIRELAAQLDRPADGLYHHVRTLLKAGIVVERDLLVLKKSTKFQQLAGRGAQWPDGRWWFEGLAQATTRPGEPPSSAGGCFIRRVNRAKC
jgi:DNA-binding transcriptional ArsR family regulator